MSAFSCSLPFLTTIQKTRNYLSVHLLLGLLLSVVNIAIAGAPSTKPLLRIEPALHTAAIRRMAMDKAERFVVTASNDKTARVWDVKTGQLLQTLRPPIGVGDEGMLFAVAISPSAEQIAVAGWTGYEWDQSVSIYLFNRSTGKMQGRIRGLPNVIRHLSYSADGKVLAVALGEGEGIRFYRSVPIKSEYHELARDTDYTQNSYSINFDTQGRSVSTSHDGYLRLYDRQFKKILQKKVVGGRDPFFARFSPDATRIAVGFFDSTAVTVLAAENLSLFASAETSRFTQGNLSKVAWSKNGQQLYAAGRYDNGMGNPIITWSTNDWTTYQSYTAAQSTVMEILPLADGGLLFASTDPALGRLDKLGQSVWKQGAGKLDFRGRSARRAFKLSDHADYISFHYRYENSLGQLDTKTASWDLKQLSLNTVNNKTLHPPLLNTTELDIQGWEDQYYPQLNGTALFLKEHERSRSLAIARPIQDQAPVFTLGTNWLLRFYNHQGIEQWQQAVPYAWIVNISADGRYVLAALGDGTIRWYQTDNGQERLALYLHPEAIKGKPEPRWIAWTPEGFYAASSKAAESLMGFHLNQGPDKASRFVNASQLSEVFDRADLVTLALDQQYPKLAAKALQQAGDLNSILDAGLAPKIHLLGDDKGQLSTRHFTLKFSLEDLGGGIGKIEYWVDGKLVNMGGTRAYASRLPAGQRYRRDFTLNHGRHKVVVKVFNKNNQISSESAVKIVEVNDPVYREPSLYVLSVGVSQYKDPSFQLKYAADDAFDFSMTLQKQGIKLYKNIVFSTLRNQEATLTRITEEFKKMAAQAQAQDVFVFYLAGHGTVADGRYHFIPYELIYENQDSLKQALTEAKLKALIASVETSKSLMVLDSCHAGQVIPALAMLDESWTRGINDKTAINRLMNTTGVAVLAAAGKEQQAREGIIEGGKGHGLFTHILLKGLKGAADGNKDKQIDIEELITYTRKQVPAISQEKWQYKQFPMFQSPQQNFPIALLAE